MQTNRLTCNNICVGVHQRSRDALRPHQSPGGVVRIREHAIVGKVPAIIPGVGVGAAIVRGAGGEAVRGIVGVRW
jgi:hypothetical protein